MAEAGIRELRDHLSKYIDLVREGGEVVVTDRGKAVARVVPIGRPRVYDRLVHDGVIQPSRTKRRARPDPRTSTDGTVSDLVADQRR